MKLLNTKNLAIYGAVGAVGTYLVASKLLKASNKTSMIAAVVVGAIGAYVGNNS